MGAVRITLNCSFSFHKSISDCSSQHDHISNFGNLFKQKNILFVKWTEHNNVTVYGAKHGVFIRAPHTTCCDGNDRLFGLLWELTSRATSVVWLLGRKPTSVRLIRVIKRNAGWEQCVLEEAEAWMNLVMIPGEMPATIESNSFRCLLIKNRHKTPLSQSHHLLYVPTRER